MKSKKVTLGGTEVSVVTIGSFAQACGRSVATFRIYCRSGVLPEANIRMPDTTFDSGFVKKGERLYTIELVKEVAILMQRINHGQKTPEDVKINILKAFKNERERLNL